MNCFYCGKELFVTKGQKPKKYCNDSCKMSFYRRNRNEELEKSNAEEEKLREVVIVGESPNARSSRQYKEFQKGWIYEACLEFRIDVPVAFKGKLVSRIHYEPDMTCKCGKVYIRHHEARYVVQHSWLL